MIIMTCQKKKKKTSRAGGLGDPLKEAASRDCRLAAVHVPTGAHTHSVAGASGCCIGSRLRGLLLGTSSALCPAMRLPLAWQLGWRTGAQQT